MPEIKPLKSVQSAAARDTGAQDEAPAAPTQPTQLSPAPAKLPTLAPPPAAPAAKPKPARTGRVRMLLMVVVPVVALIAAGWYWLGGGRYVTTDNAYVGADKSLITPLVSGPIVAIHVVEGQKVRAGDPLFDIDPSPFQTALLLAKGRQDAARIGFENLRASYVSNEDQIKMGADAVRLRQSDFDRKQALLSTHATTQVDTDTSMAALIQARQILEFVRSQQDATKVKLGGGLDATIDKFPEYIQATAQVYDAERNLRNTHILSPISGVATQVSQIELGRLVAQGSAVFAVVADHDLWVDGNPKESDLTYVRQGQPATVTVDAFPDREWRGNICSIAPGTGAQFAILPAQNASGNWVKVVQRVPLRFCFDPDQDMANLRAGMSADVSIDTGRSRSLRSVVDGIAGGIDDLIHPASAKAAVAK
jgi:membrane fusion protein (multidrug efflux system)